MKRFLLGMVLPLVFATAGCAIHTHPTDMQNLPGGDRMAKGPGLLDRNSRYASDNGLVVYSSNPNQASLVGPGRAAPSAAAPRPPVPAAAAPSAAPLSPQDYDQFREFQAYQRFMSLPENAPQRVEFRQWLQWQYYRQWQAKHGR